MATAFRSEPAELYFGRGRRIFPPGFSVREYKTVKTNDSPDSGMAFVHWQGLEGVFDLPDDPGLDWLKVGATFRVKHRNRNFIARIQNCGHEEDSSGLFYWWQFRQDFDLLTLPILTEYHVEEILTFENALPDSAGEYIGWCEEIGWAERIPALQAMWEQYKYDRRSRRIVTDEQINVPASGVVAVFGDGRILGASGKYVAKRDIAPGELVRFGVDVEKAAEKPSRRIIFAPQES